MYFSCSTTGSISFFHERRRRQIGLKICYPSFVWRFTSEAKVKSVLFVNLHRSSCCTQKVKDQPRLFVLYSSIIWLLFHFSSLLTSYLRDSSSYVLSFVSELKKKRGNVCTGPNWEIYFRAKPQLVLILSLQKRDNFKPCCILEVNHFQGVFQFNFFSSMFTQDLGNCNELYYSIN